MAAPTVFVSSSFYNLRYVREGLRRFIESLGYIAVLSEDGTVFYDPRTSAAEACMAEIGNADMFVLILGGRYGSPMPDGSQSVTNAEYQQAVKIGIPVFALVENDTYSDYHLYQANRGHPDILKQIAFPHADSTRIFEFVDQVLGQTVNNALVPFRTAADIENYLRSQWAGMLHTFLSRNNQQAQVSSSLEMLGQVNTRIELLAEQILNAVGKPLDRVVVRLLQQMVNSTAVADLYSLGGRPTPGAILSHDTVEKCAKALEINFRVTPERGNVLSSNGSVSRSKFTEMSGNYSMLRKGMQEIVSQSPATAEEIVAYEHDNPDILRSESQNMGWLGLQSGQSYGSGPEPEME